MPPFEKHIFICTNQRPENHPRGCCASKGSVKIKELFAEALQRYGLKGRMRANSAGCLDNCELGPAVVVYPEGVWYRVENAQDVETIVKEHLIGGNVVQSLAVYPPKS